jgi:molybdenum cofactor cytidylyltransferase
MIAGIVLAAGLSRRMGRPKAFLTLDGELFLDRAVRVLREGGCGLVVIVTNASSEVGGHALELSEQANRDPDAPAVITAVNPSFDSEQLESLRIGLRALPDAATAAMVLPVDMPTASGVVAAAVREAFERVGAPIVVPASEGRHGHPVLFARALWPELLEGELPEGARSVVHAHLAELVEVPVPSLPADVDTPEDYRRLLEERA